jgi:hypothetical protein
MKRLIILSGILCMLILAACSKKDKTATEGSGGANTELSDPQLHQVIGTVVDGSDGTVLVGATVLRKASSSGTVTNEQGKFSILVPFGPSERLVISFLGYQTRELGLYGTTDFGIIQLWEDTSSE